MKNITTEIKITLSIKETDDPNIDPLDFVEANIVHEDCGNKKLDELADSLGTMFSFFLQELKTATKGIKQEEIRKEMENEKDIDRNRYAK